MKVLKELGNAVLGDTPEDIEQYRTDTIKLIAVRESGGDGSSTANSDTSSTTSTDFEKTADAFVKYRQEKAPDRILDWHKFDLIKSKKEKRKEIF